MSANQIAVVGAGLAGLTVALRLHQKGCDVQVYEARQRVGGRVFTALMKNISGSYSTAELGGQNISDGGKSNCLLKLAFDLELNIETKIVPNLCTVCTGGIYLDLQDLLPQPPLSDEQIMRAAIGCESMAELLNKLFPDNALLKMVCTSRLIGYEGLKTQDQSVYHNIESLKAMLKGKMPGSLESHTWIHNSIRGGNAQLPLKIAKVLGERVNLNKALVRVSNENERIKLLFTDGSTIYCDKLVLAVPAPLYSSIKFEPDVVPQQQLQAIQSVKYGANQKVLVPTTRPNIGFDSPMVTEKLLSFFNFATDVLIMYFFNPDGLKFFDKQLHMLQRGYRYIGVGKQLLVQAKDMQFIKYDTAVTHCWLKDLYAKGSFSGYNAVLSSSLDNKVSYKGIVIKEIFQPVSDRVFFVGEHTTILNEVGTMEAAVESGERIASLFLPEFK